jgi:hypothetical protein
MLKAGAFGPQQGGDVGSKKISRWIVHPRLKMAAG